MTENRIPVINPDDTDLSNELFEGIEQTEAEEKIDYHPVKAILLILSALLFFSCMDCTIKYLVLRYNAPMVVAVRYIVHCLLMLIILVPTQGVKFAKTKRTGLVIFRGVCLLIASLCVGSALRLIPVAEMTSIVFLAPMLVMFMAKSVLGEKVGILGWVAAGIGFSGVLLVVRPGSGVDMTALIYLFFAVLANALYQLLSRVLANTEKTVAILFYTALIGAVGMGIFLPWYWEGEISDLLTILLFISVGVTGGFGHFLYTKAFRFAPASMLAPMNYLQLIWAGFFGWLVFGDVPSGLTILGMVIIACSGALVALKSVNTNRLSGLLRRKSKP